jgi:geranylgeranylglycerol-phosphate geranylgeranyltransferase
MGLRRLSDSMKGLSPMTKAKFTGLYRLFRIELSFTAGICVLLGELLALSGLPSLAQALFGFLGIFCISSTALILNDYFDIETDRINAQHRPLPSGLVTQSEALGLSIVVALLGFFFGFIISVEVFLLALFVWAIGLLYNWRFKKVGLIGNLFVGFSVGMTFIFGGLVVGNPFEAVVWYLAITTMLVDLGEEIAADSLDVEGDRKTGSLSLAVRLGPETAMRISACIFGLVIAGSAFPFIFGWFEWFYLPPLLFLDFVIIYSTRRLLDPQQENRIKDIQRIYRSGLLVFIVIIGIRLST